MYSFPELVTRPTVQQARSNLQLRIVRHGRKSTVRAWLRPNCHYFSIASFSTKAELPSRILVSTRFVSLLIPFSTIKAHVDTANPKYDSLLHLKFHPYSQLLLLRSQGIIVCGRIIQTTHKHRAGIYVTLSFLNIRVVFNGFEQSNYSACNALM